MKKLAAAAALLVAGTGAVLAPSAQAATATFTLKAGAFAPYGSAAQAWKASKCNTAVIGSPADGIESKILDARPFANRVTKVSWTGTFDLNGGTGVAMTMHTYDAGCTETTIGASPAGLRKWSLTVPANARWIVIQADKAVDLTVTVAA